jgi:acetylglutamate kinase
MMTTPTRRSSTMQMVGEIVSIDLECGQALQDDAFIPITAPMGFRESNESNINADVVAGKLATVLPRN